MGNLSVHRLNGIHPFSNVGMDFAGPVYTKCAHKISVTMFKSYICCTATKAIHLELVSDLSTAAFLAALRSSLQGVVSNKIISDNGSDFKGASRLLKRLSELCKQSEIQGFSSMKSIEWSFISPYTPHFGGLWEPAIKSAKQLLTKISNSVLLNFEQFFTLLHLAC